VVIVSYEWFKRAHGDLPFTASEWSPPAAKQQMAAFFADLERELEKAEFFRPAEKRATMVVNLRNVFQRMVPTQQDMRTLHGVVTALVHGRKGPARGGVLDSEEAGQLRAAIAEQGAGEGTPVRGLAKLLRRNPTETERALWQALTNDRRFAGLGFKRQVPIGPHIVDFVSFPMRRVIDLVPPAETDEAARTRAEKRAWLAAHDYAVSEVLAADVEKDVKAVLDTLSVITGPPRRGETP
jgi:tRNA/rRNA methyltransferase